MLPFSLSETDADIANIERKTHTSALISCAYPAPRFRYPPAGSGRGPALYIVLQAKICAS